MENHVGAQGPPPWLANGGNGHSPYVTDARNAAVELLKYGMFLLRRWRVIAGVTLGVTLAIAIYVRFLTQKVWRAEAMVTPVSPSESAQNEVGGSMMDPFSGGGGLASLFGFAGQSDNAIIAQRYITIMNSYAFTMSLVDRYHLDRMIIEESGRRSKPLTRWALYKEIGARFSYAYDYKSGNLSLYFVDRDPSQAKRVLGFYLENLRDKLRSEVVQSASQASQSLEEQVNKTSDALLQSQLYELLARQIQHQKLAQVQADFAFKVIDPPFVPDTHYGYGLRVWIPLAFSLTLFAMCAFFVIGGWISSARGYLASEVLARAPRGDADVDVDDLAVPDDEARANLP